MVKVVITQQLDSTTLEAFSNLTDSMIIWIIQFAKRISNRRNTTKFMRNTSKFMSVPQLCREPHLWEADKYYSGFIAALRVNDHNNDKHILLIVH